MERVSGFSGGGLFAVSQYTEEFIKTIISTLQLHFRLVCDTPLRGRYPGRPEVEVSS